MYRGRVGDVGELLDELTPELEARFGQLIDERFTALLAGAECKRTLKGAVERARLSQPLLVGSRRRLTIHASARVKSVMFNTSSGTILVEEDAFIAHSAALLTGTHDVDRQGLDRLEGVPTKGRDIRVGRGAWIATGAIIIGPCTIGENAVVAAGAVVTKDVAPATMVAGNPAIVIGTLGPNGERPERSGGRARGLPDPDPEPVEPDPRTARVEFFDRANELTSAMVADTQWGAFLVDTSDRTVGRSLFTNRGRNEMRDLGSALSVLEREGFTVPLERSTFLDVGANIGTSTITALTSHGFARAIAVEPAERNQRLLRANLALNGLEGCVVVHAAAASDAEGEVHLALSDLNSGGHEVASGRRQGERPEEIVTVAAVTLDGLAARGELDPTEVGLLWMDVQGYEGHVLAGARDVITVGMPIVLEFHPTMLRDTGGMQLLEEAVAGTYATFVDLRRVARGPRVEYRARPIEELAAIETDLVQDGKEYTDILLLAGAEA